HSDRPVSDPGSFPCPPCLRVSVLNTQSSCQSHNTAEASPQSSRVPARGQDRYLYSHGQDARATLAAAAGEDAEEGFDVGVGANVAVAVEVGGVGAGGGGAGAGDAGEEVGDVAVGADVAVAVEVGRALVDGRTFDADADGGAGAGLPWGAGAFLGA